MKELCFVLCTLAMASASPDHRTRDRQTLLPYPIPFGHVANPNSINHLPSHSPTSLPYMFKAQPPSPYSGAWPFPSRPYSTSGPFKYNPSLYESPSAYTPHSHEIPPYWPYPTQVFYASQYHPLHPPHRPNTPMHHTENSQHPPSYPSPTYSTAKPLTPHDSYHIEISPQQHTIHNHEEAPLHPSRPYDSSLYHNTHEESNHSPSLVAHTPLHPHTHDTTSHLHHGSHYLDTHGESNSDPLHSTPKPPQGILTSEMLLQFLQNPLNLRASSPFLPPPPPQPPRIMILRPLETHSEGASGITSEASDGNTVQSQLPLTRSNTEDVEDRKEPSRDHVLWETMYHPILWEHKWSPKWDLKNYNLHHLWNTKWPERWMPWKKDHAAPHQDSHLALEPWDHVTVHHAPPHSSNPYLGGLAHYPVYPIKQTLSLNHQPEDYFEANRPHTLEEYLQHDEPWANKHLLEKLLQDNNEQAYQHTRDPAQYYHHRPKNPGYNIYSPPGHRQFTHIPWLGAQGPDASSGAPEGRLLDEPEPSQSTPPHPEGENRLLETEGQQHDVEPISRSSGVDDVEYQPEGRVMSHQTEQWLPPDQSQDVETLPSPTSSDDVIDARPRNSKANEQPSIHPWLPPSYLPPMTSRGGRTRAIARDASLV